MMFFQKHLPKAILWTTFLAFIILAILAFPFFDVKPAPSVFKIFYILGILFFFYFEYAVSHIKLKRVSFIIITLLMAFLLRLWWIFTVPTEVVSDFEIFFQHAEKFANGNTAVYGNSGYYNKWPGNIGFPIIEGLLLFVVKSMMGLKIIFVVFSTAAVYLLYQLSNDIFNSQTARIIALLSAFFPPFIFYTSVNTNQTFSIFFTLLAFLVFVKRKHWIWVGLLLAIAHFIRPTGIVFWASFLGYVIYSGLMDSSFRLKHLFENVIGPIIKLTVSFWALLFAIHFLLMLSGIKKEGFLYNDLPKYKVLVGLNQESNGRYSVEDGALTNDFETYNLKVDSIIQKRLENKTDVAILLGKKFVSMWSSGDDALYWAEKKNLTIPYKSFFQNISHAYYLWILVFASLFILLNPLGKGQNLPDFIWYVLITLLGIFFIYLIIEIQTRYRYEIYPLMLLLAGAGIQTGFSRIFPVEKSKL